MGVTVFTSKRVDMSTITLGPGEEPRPHMMRKTKVCALDQETCPKPGSGGTRLKPSTGEAQAGRPQLVQDQPGLHREFKDSQDYIERPCLKRTNPNKQARNK